MVALGGVMFWTVLLLAGFLCGLRAFTPLAVSTFFLRHGRLHLAGTPLAFMATVPAHIVVVLLALLELVGDKLPKTPSRTSLMGLSGRIWTGALTGAMLAFATGGCSWWAGAIAAVVAALIGTYVGWFCRTRIVAALKCP